MSSFTEANPKSYPFLGIEEHAQPRKTRRNNKNNWLAFLLKSTPSKYLNCRNQSRSNPHPLTLVPSLKPLSRFAGESKVTQDLPLLITPFSCGTTNSYLTQIVSCLEGRLAQKCYHQCKEFLCRAEFHIPQQ